MNYQACPRVMALSLSCLLAAGSVSAQRRDFIPPVPPPEGPVVLYTAEVQRIRVVPVTGDLSHPWGMAFRQNGDILIPPSETGPRCAWCGMVSFWSETFRGCPRSSPSPTAPD